MAERVGIDRSFLADVERGKRNVSILNVELMAKGLKVCEFSARLIRHRHWHCASHQPAKNR
jgi:transcriptional regulator with XRE-family HTH domain